VADRLLGIVVSGRNAEALESVLRHEAVEAAWCVWSGNDLTVYDAVVDAGAVEPLLDLLEQRFGPDEEFRARHGSEAARRRDPRSRDRSRWRSGAAEA